MGLITLQRYLFIVAQPRTEVRQKTPIPDFATGL